MNKLPIGQVVTGAQVGGSAGGNDQENEDSIDRTSLRNGITLERKRPRYSIVCFALNGPNLNATSGSDSMLGPEVLAPDFDIGSVSFNHGNGVSIDFQHEFREPSIFLGGQVFVGHDLADTPSTTLISVVKREVADVGTGATTYDVITIDSRTVNNRDADDPTQDATDVLYDIPGGRAFFAAGERFGLTVQPDTDSASGTSSGLRGVSVILWFKTLHV